MNQFPMLGRFNQWANERLYESCAGMADAERKRDRKAFFGSIHNTLNHLLVVDRLWLGRIEGAESGIKSLDQVLYGDFDGLRAARRKKDQRLIAFVDGIPENRLAETISYTRMSEPRLAQTKPLHVLLITLFNHQTHHRGQVHNMLSQAGIAPPALDIINFV
ncbi:MAG: damage-inducible protein DinB [Rhodospirillales bacterium]|nr:damage-inducible protein DinB [Rhodospirillales bacterium]